MAFKNPFKNDDGLEIVNIDGKSSSISSNKKIVIIGICVLCVVLIGGFAICNLHNNNTTPEDNAEYEKVAKKYKKQNIDYSYEDYKKDKAADEELNKKLDEAKDEKEKAKILDDWNKQVSSGGSSSPVSDARATVVDKNQQVLDELRDGDSEPDSSGVINNGNGTDISVDTIKQTIIDYTKTYNDYVKNHCGWPESKYDASMFQDSWDYYQGILDYMSNTKNEHGTPMEYLGVSVKDQCRDMRYAMYYQIPYTINTANNGFDKNLKGYIEARYPQFNVIYSMVIDGVQEEFDTEKSEICCYVQTDKGNFNVYMVSHDSSEYVLLDIQKA